ncbi:MAG: sensor histidine kinase [Eubacteriaceae bacterium]
MFKKLHKKLAFMNALILISFLLIFSYSIVGISSYVLDKSSKQSLQRNATQLIDLSQRRNSFNLIFLDVKLPGKDMFHDMIDTDYVIWDDDLDISTISKVEDELIQKLYTYSKKIYINKSSKFNNFQIDGESFRLYSVYYELYDGSGGVIQVYQSKMIEKEILKSLFLVIVLIGSVSSFILIIISAYLAKKSLEPVRISYERQKEFIGDASHELRTPLTVMRTNLDLLSMKEDETIKENKKWFNNIASETETMAKLVNNLLTLAQVDNKQVSTTFNLIDISEIAKKVCDKLAVIAVEKEIVLKSDILNDVKINGNEDKIEQLLVILIDNAIKYTQKGGDVRVTLTATSEKVIINIKDSGIGISEEDKNKIFDRFYRVDKVRSREQGGSGLGLSIARWIIADHQATIDINSQLGEGSEFILEFPNVTTYRKNLK